ncbi:uncharacterized protein CBL_11715 [Carabus blaptoides fortunei]
MLALLMKGRIPRFEDIRRTFASLIQSVAFLSATGLGYSAFLCSLRWLCGHFNILSVSSMPIFLSSILAIHLERPSRMTVVMFVCQQCCYENRLEYAGIQGNAMLLMYTRVVSTRQKMEKATVYSGYLDSLLDRTRNMNMFRNGRNKCHTILNNSSKQLTYNMGIESGHVPQVPGFTKILYCFSTAILFHAGIIEPNNLRPSYYKFLHNLSGGRISRMDRTALDVWGCESTKQIAITLRKTKTDTIVRHII